MVLTVEPALVELDVPIWLKSDCRLLLLLLLLEAACNMALSRFMAFCVEFVAEVVD